MDNLMEAMQLRIRMKTYENIHVMIEQYDRKLDRRNTAQNFDEKKNKFDME